MTQVIFDSDIVICLSLETTIPSHSDQGLPRNYRRLFLGNTLSELSGGKALEIASQITELKDAE